MKLFAAVLIAAFAVTVGAQSKPPLTLNYSCGSGAGGVPWSCSPIVTGGTPPYKFSITYSGDIPPTWITIDAATGVLSGTPPYSFTMNPNAPTDLRLLIAKLNQIDKKKRKDR